MLNLLSEMKKSPVEILIGEAGEFVFEFVEHAYIFFYAEKKSYLCICFKRIESWTRLRKTL